MQNSSHVKSCTGQASYGSMPPSSDFVNFDRDQSQQREEHPDFDYQYSTDEHEGDSSSSTPHFGAGAQNAFGPEEPRYVQYISPEQREDIESGSDNVNYDFEIYDDGKGDYVDDEYEYTEEAYDEMNPKTFGQRHRKTKLVVKEEKGYNTGRVHIITPIVPRPAHTYRGQEHLKPADSYEIPLHIPTNKGYQRIMVPKEASANNMKEIVQKLVRMKASAENVRRRVVDAETYNNENQDVYNTDVHQPGYDRPPIHDSREFPGIPIQHDFGGDPYNSFNDDQSALPQQHLPDEQHELTHVGSGYFSHEQQPAFVDEERYSHSVDSPYLANQAPKLHDSDGRYPLLLPSHQELEFAQTDYSLGGQNSDYNTGNPAGIFVDPSPNSFLHSQHTMRTELARLRRLH